MKDLRIQPLSILRRDGLQRVDISAVMEAPGHYRLSVYEGDICRAREIPFALPGGKAAATVWLTPPAQAFRARWVVMDREGNVVARVQSEYPPPRRWTFYVMVSSHIDLGLPNAPHVQRAESARFIEASMKLSRDTADRPEESRYRYVAEGTWVWNSHRAEYGAAAARAAEAARRGDLGVCAGVAGNHIQSYGLEELCRSAYSRKWLLEQGVPSKTMTMIDVPGLPWSMVQPYADAGYENIIFAPNNYAPKLSTVWRLDSTVPWPINNPESVGGGTRIDIRYDGHLPMLFFWEGASKRRLLIWASAQYGVGGERFGISAFGNDVRAMADRMAENLPKLEARVPYDIWLVANYYDNMEPELGFADSLAEWNRTYAYPQLRMLGNPDEPFELVKARFGDSIPVLRGDITNGWAPGTAAAAMVLSKSLEADRKLPTAEKLSALAAVYAGRAYPAKAFERAWASLIMNDEHSYGVGEYYGRDVCETWMQHRDWVAKALVTADTEAAASLEALARRIPGTGERVVVFNPTAIARREHIAAAGECLAEIPPFGYRVLRAEDFRPRAESSQAVCAPPVLENEFYRVAFSENGSLKSIFDKQCGRTINDGNCNEMLYTRDNHATFHSPKAARFTVQSGAYQDTVIVRTEEAVSGAALIQTITLPKYEKRIDIENQVLHARDMIVSQRTDRSRYDRYLYFAFPFRVENCRRYCDLGGIEAEYGVDLTGHSTDVYMAAHEYCCAENPAFGVGLIQLDSQLVEFDHIHADKSDFGEPGTGAAVYSYVANSWFHHKHLPGGNAVGYRFRYTITSYAGTHVEADLARMAERIANPVLITSLAEICGGPLPPDSASFLQTDARLVNLKRAADGNGLIARLYRARPETAPLLLPGIAGCDGCQPTALDETEDGAKEAPVGFSTYRLGAGRVCLPTREEVAEPMAIGSALTGLISSPRAASAFDAEPGTLYLLWGKCACTELSHYELFRSFEPDFTANAQTLIARVEPGKHAVVSYLDTGLPDDASIYYRVRAVMKTGERGPLSDEFSGLTRER